MSLKKLVIAASVLVGSSTAALAQPYYSTASARGGVTVSVRDHRDVDWQWMRNHRRPVVRPVRAQINYYAASNYSAQPSYWNEPVYAPPSLQLMAPESLVSGRIQLPIDPASLAGKTTLRISAAGGLTHLDRVTLDTASHTAQLVEIQQNLGAGGYYDIPLAHCSDLDGLVIDGQSSYGGAITVSAF